MEVWNLSAIEKSERILDELKGYADFVIIGGWAVYLWTKSVKSVDIDIYIDFNEFYKIQNLLSEKGIFINFNQNLRKYSAKIDEVEIDIYTPDQCNLIVPCKDVFKDGLFEIVGGFKVIKPEPLLILKLDAENKRHVTMKGFKDRCDILAILNSGINMNLLTTLINKYGGEKHAQLTDIVKSSAKEYVYALGKELTPRQLKLKKQQFLEELKKI